MQTQCNESRIEFHGLGERVLTADFDGGNMVSDGGVPLVAEVDRIAVRAGGRKPAVSAPKTA